jgi:hypothetical protein
MAETGRFPLVILGMRTPGGRRIYARHRPLLEQTGFKSEIKADGSWPADGSALAGEGSEPVLALGRAVLGFGRIKESLSARTDDPLVLWSGGSCSDLEVVLANEVQSDGRRHFSAVLAGDCPVGGWVQIELNYPGLGPREALRRFSGRVRRMEVFRERAVLRLRAV